MTTGDIITNVPPVLRVQLKSLWADEWAAFANVEPLGAVLNVAPSHSTAELLFRFGSIVREEAVAFATVTEAIDQKGAFVRIQFESPAESDTWVTLFVGWIQREEIQALHPAGGIATGDQVLAAHGLETALDRVPTYQSLVEVPTASGDTTVPKLIEDTLTFNQRHRSGLTTLGNRSENKHQDGTWDDQSHHLFSDSGEVWTGKDICEYLALFNEVSGIRWRLVGDTELVDAIEPAALNSYGQTTRNILDRLIERQRGMGWCVRVIADDEGERADIAQIHVFSVFDTPVVVDGATLPANGEQATIDLDDRHDMDGTPYIVLDGTTVFDWITVRGARVKSVFTISVPGGDLVPGWTDVEFLAYQNAINDKVRQEDGYKNVYSLWRLRPDWGWRNAEGFTVVPEIDNDGRIVQGVSAPTRDWGHTFLRDLPLIESWSPQSGDVEYRKPFALIGHVHADADGNPVAKFHYAEAPFEDGPEESFRLRMLDNAAGFHIEAAGPPHILGLGNTGFSNTDTPPVWDPSTLNATVAMETDSVLAVNVALGAIDPTTKPTGRVLLIKVPDAELWYLVPRSIIGLTHHGLPVWSGVPMDQRVLRDDSARLRTIAALAQQWYGVQRQAVRFTLQGLITDYVPGSFLTVTTASWTREAVGSVVTSVAYDLRSFLTTIQTGYESLDPAAAAQ